MMKWYGGSYSKCVANEIEKSKNFKKDARFGLSAYRSVTESKELLFNKLLLATKHPISLM